MNLSRCFVTESLSILLKTFIIVFVLIFTLPVASAVQPAGNASESDNKAFESAGNAFEPAGNAFEPANNASESNVNISDVKKKFPARISLIDGTVTNGVFELNEGEATDGSGSIPRKMIKEVLFSTEEKSVVSKKSEAEGTYLSESEKTFVDEWTDASAVILELYSRHHYRSDSTWIVRSKIRVLTQKEDGRDAYTYWGDSFVDGRERINVLYARTIKKDGRIIDLNPEDVVISTPKLRSDMFMPGVKTAVFNFPELETGDIVEAELEKETYNPARKDFFFPSWTFQSVHPIFQNSFEIVVPENSAFRYKAKNFTGKQGVPDERIKEGERILQWAVNSMKPYVAEPMMPHVMDVLPSVRSSMVESWEVLADWIQGYWGDNVEPNAELRSLVSDIVKDAKTEDAKVAAIYHWIQENIRYIIIKGDLATIFGSYPAMETINRKFGCCVDKAIVMTAMLNCVGIKSTPVVLNTVNGFTVDPELPEIYLEHAISMIYGEDGTYFLDSTGYNYRYPYFDAADYDVWALDPLQKKLVRVESPPARDNSATYRTSMSMDINGNIEVSWWNRYTGPYEASLRGFWKSLKEEEREQRFASMILSSVPDAVLKRWSIENLEDLSRPMGLSSSYTAERFPSEAGELLICRLPDLRHSFQEVNLEERQYPIRYPAPYQRTNYYTISLADGIRISKLPEPLVIRMPGARYNAKYSVNEDGNIVFSDNYTRDTLHISVEDYPEYRLFCKTIEEYAQRRMFLIRDMNMVSVKKSPLNGKEGK